MRRKRTPKRKGTRRRRIGAMSGKSPIIKLGAAVVGYLVGDKVNTAITSAVGSSIDPKIIAGIEVLAGAFLLFKKGKPSMVKSAIGGVLLGMGVKTGLRAFGVINGGINGYQNVPVIGRRMLSGYQNVPVIGGYSPGGVHIGGYSISNRPSSHVMGSANGSGRCRQD